MKQTRYKTERIHSLDSLRAIMMLLGLVIHAATPYVFREYSIIKDPTATHISMDYLVDFIHAFRMPVFFCVAGFFGAMLFYERSALKMIKNRISRIVYPFIVFLFIIWPVYEFTNDYTILTFAGSGNTFKTALSDSLRLDILIPQRTMHLWFLYYLFYITIASVSLGLLFKKLPSRLTGRLTQLFNWIIQKPALRILVFAGITCIVYELFGQSSLYPSASFRLDFFLFTQYFVFYTFGWVLYNNKHLLTTMMRFDWLCAILGVIVLTIRISIPDHFLSSESHVYFLRIILRSITVWLFIFGITGLFIRYASNHSPTMRYLSDSSYWVYLIHIPFVIYIPGLISDWPLHATLKFSIVLITATIVCYISYHYLVRSTFIGKFLNGKKYPRVETIHSTEIATEDRYLGMAPRRIPVIQPPNEHDKSKDVNG